MFSKSAQAASRRAASGSARKEWAAVFGIVAVTIAACTPTVRLQVDPIQIYAKLDADVRIRLDRELQDLLAENPNLF